MLERRLAEGEICLFVLQTFLSVTLHGLSQFATTRYLPLRTYWPQNEERCPMGTVGVLKINLLAPE